MNKENRIIELGNYYSVPELFKSFLTGLIFFIVPSSLFIVLFVSIIVLYVPYLIYFLLGLYVIIVLISMFSNKVMIETLTSYQDKTDELDLKVMYYKFVLLSMIDITIVFIVGYLIYLHYV